MRALLVVALISIALGCSRRDDLPSARGGGPAVVPDVMHALEARQRIAEARCRAAAACGEENGDVCISRVEADLTIPCVATDPVKVRACEDALRARSCTDLSAPNECAGSNLCLEEEKP